MFFQAEEGIRVSPVTGVQTCALPISHAPRGTCFITSSLALLRRPGLGCVGGLLPCCVGRVGGARGIISFRRRCRAGSEPCATLGKRRNLDATVNFFRSRGEGQRGGGLCPGILTNPYPLGRGGAETMAYRDRPPAKTANQSPWGGGERRPLHHGPIPWGGGRGGKGKKKGGQRGIRKKKGGASGDEEKNTCTNGTRKKRTPPEGGTRHRSEDTRPQIATYDT